MLYRTEDFARWGAGKGTNLEPVEIDLNFWELAERLVAVEASAGTAANGIANIGVVGSQMTVYLQDGTALGPYTLPTAMIRYRGDWTAASVYGELDLVTVPDVGVYLVLQDHTSDAAFDALAEDAEGNPLYRWLFPMGTGGGGGGASSMAELTDVDLVSEPPVTGQSLVFFGDTWYPGVPSMGLADLQGVFITNPPFSGGLADGHVLTWVAADSAWRNRPPASGGGSAVSVSDEGTQVLATPTDINFAGAGVSVASDGDGTLTVTIPGGGTGGGALAVSDEGAQIIAAPTDINFVGSGVTVTDDGDGTVTVTISGGTGGGAGALSDLSDVTVTGPAAGQFLRYNGTIFVNAAVDWSDVANKPATFAPAAHQHPWSDLTGVPSIFAPAAHTHPATEIGGVVVEAVAGTTYAQVAGDHKKWKRTTSAAAVTVTVDANVNAAEDEIIFQQGGDGAISFQAGAGMTLTTSGTLVSGGPGAVVGIKFLSATEAAIFGHTTGVSGGGGSGDMLAVLYDPTGVSADSFARANHHGEQGIATVTGLQAALDAKAPLVHTHVLADLNIGGAPDGTKFLRDDGTWASVAAGLGDMTAAVYDPQGVRADAFARANHTGEQAIGTITGLQGVLDGKASSTHTHAYAELIGVPATFTPSAHTHPVTDIQTTGTPDGTKFLRDDGQWAEPAGGESGPASGFVFLATAEAANDATIDFTDFDGGLYDSYLFVVSNLIGVTSNVTLMLRFSDDGTTYAAVAGDYRFIRHHAYPASQHLIASGVTVDHIVISTSVGQQAINGCSGQVLVTGAHRADAATRAVAHFCSVDHSNNFRQDVATGDRAAAVVTAGARFMLSTGNIAGGSITMYGLRKA